MRQILKQSLAILSFSIFILTGCKKDFLDVNKDPNRVTDDNINAELIFPAAAEGVGATPVGARATGAGAQTSMQFAQNWIGYMASNGDFARDPTQTTYNIDFTFGDNLFQTRYGVLFDLHQCEIKAIAGNDTALAAASMILSAKMFQELVDLFGNIPYSQAFEVNTTTRPAYDKAKDIYQSLQLKLDTAISYLRMGSAPKKFAAADIVNHGDVDKWIKLANTIKLRLLIRQSEVSGFNPSAEISKIFANLNQNVLGKGESVSVNPGYVNDVDKQSPFYANYGFTPTNVIATSSTNANDYIVNILAGTNDPRISRYFTPVGTAFVGDVYGDEPGNIPPGNQSSYFGPGLVSSPTQNQWVLPSYESLFFKAEAIARGWVTITGETAESVYKDAVTESFTWLGVPDPVNAAATYMANNAIADFANAGTDPSSQAKFIVYQKYLANVGIDPQESYSDQRRLNFLPVGFISVNPSKVSNTLPLRLLYPQSEYTTNSENVLKEGTIDAFTSKLFWEP